MADAGKRTPTMTDVARLAGVSQRTVSNVVSDYPHVAPATRAKVQQAIAELGFRPNVAAQRLRQGRTGIVALAVPSLAWPYFGELAHLVQRAAHDRGQTLLVAETEGDADFERSVLRGFRTNLIDGLILSPIALTTADLRAMDLGFPVVLVGERISDAGVLHLAIDNAAGAREVVRHLWQQGARSFVILGGTDSAMTSSAGTLRMNGFVSELTELGAAPDHWRAIGGSPWTQEDGYRTIRDHLRAGNRPDAILAMNDLAAFGAIRACWERGLAVPGDVLISGWDDIALGRFTTPSITTIAPDKEAVATQAVEGVIGALGRAAPGAEEVVIEHRLVVRESTRRSA